MRAFMIAGMLLLLAGSSGVAQTRCRVMDPTGTPLNVRSSPNGPAVSALPNGVLVSVTSSATDDRGRAWVFIADYASGQTLGWVFREFIACF